MLFVPEVFISFVFLISSLSLLINRENSGGHRTPSVHHPERQRHRRAGPATRSRVWPAHGAAGQQAGVVQKADGETSVPPRRTETSPSLRDEEVETVDED